MSLHPIATGHAAATARPVPDVRLCYTSVVGIAEDTPLEQLLVPRYQNMGKAMHAAKGG